MKLKAFLRKILSYARLVPLNNNLPKVLNTRKVKIYLYILGEDEAGKRTVLAESVLDMKDVDELILDIKKFSKLL